MNLNEAQKKAVEATEGRVLILAGAGSGKTSVLAHRMAYLVKTKKIPPESILGLTFTNKAAQEMRERVGRLLEKEPSKKLTLSTFHSFCMKILRKEIHRLGYTSNFTLYDEREVKRLTNQLVRHTLEHEGDLPAVDELMNEISVAKNKGIPPEDPLKRDLFEKLEISMRAYNVVDFDSLLSLTLRLFEEHPDVLKKYQDQYRYIMIDEYQDTNPIQYRLAKLLSAKHQNLCVVGDDDQSIYGWRGAEIKNILEFESQTVVKLEQNYRSTPTILRIANTLITHNKQRHDKQLWSSADSGDLVSLFHAPTDVEEAQSVIQRMIALHTHEKVPWSQMAILYRSNILSRPFELALMQAQWQGPSGWVRGIPYEVIGGTEFYERAETKDLIAYLRTVCNPFDQEALLRIINTPRRGISDATLDTLTQQNRTSNTPLWKLLKSPPALSERARQAVERFVSLIETAQEKFSTGPLVDALSWLIEEIDYKKAIDDEVKSEKMRAFKWENVSHCLDMVAIYEQENLNPNLRDFLSNTLLDKSNLPDRHKDKQEDKVHLMTFHGAKGLEFTACYLVGLEDHVLPHEKSLAETGIEEERRLFYVALTRAKKYLTLSMARSRKKMGRDIQTNPSRFLFELPKELLKVTSHKVIG